MGLEIYTIEQGKKWDDIVYSFPNYDTYWLSGYVKAFQIHGDGEPLLFYYEDCNIRGINVVMMRDIEKDKLFKGKILKDQYYDFTSPYGYGGWLICGENKNRLFEQYIKWCKNNNIVSEFVRFHPVIENQINSKEIYEIIPLGNTVVMDISSPYNIWNNFTSKNRNMIRKAQKNGIKIYNGRCPDIYKVFKVIYDTTMKRDQADDYYYFNSEFYKSILEDIPYNAQAFYAEYDNKIIAVSIMLMANGKMSYHLSGSLKEFSHLAPTNLLLFEAALWGNANNYKTLYLGGGVGSEEDSLFKFKKAFYRKDDLKKFYIGKKIYLQEIYNNLLQMRDRGKIHRNFFPEYRA